MKTTRFALLALALAIVAQGAAAGVHIPRRHLPRVPPTATSHIPRKHIPRAPTTTWGGVQHPTTWGGTLAPVPLLCGLLPFLPGCKP
jgi:hypothetical protein